MNIINTASPRAAALAAALFLVPSIVSASNASLADHASQLFASTGFVHVTEAGPYVELGSYRIQVWTMLGRPYKQLADGSYLYRGFSVDERAASGTLVVRFSDGRVSDLLLVSRAVETAMLTTPASAKSTMLIASR